MPLENGTRLGPYEVLAPIAAGGMGEVYRASDERLDRVVALKVLPESFAEDPARMERFQREAKALAAFTHPNIVQIYDIGEEGGRAFIAMEYVEGRTLSQLLEDGALSAEQTLALATQIVDGLVKAHEAGIIHRDLKPANLIINTDGLVKILDFGLAKLHGGTDEFDSSLETLEREATTPGTVLGTPGFMAPEQVRGEVAGFHSDQFSFGAIAYEMASGSGAFRRDSAAESIVAVLKERPAPLSSVAPETPRELCAIIERCLEKEPARRFPTTPDLSAALHGVDTGETAAPKPSRGRHHAVARSQAREFLDECLRSAMASRGQLACVTGEAGIGKSTLVQWFLDDTRDAHPVIGRGRSSERLAGAEAYLPVFAALDDLLQGPFRDELARTMRSEAPTWYEEVRRSEPGERAPSQERLKREIASFVKRVAATHGLVLFFDDVHWADLSTIDLISYLSTQLEGTRLLLIATYRPDELRLSEHAFSKLKLDLQARGLCREFALPFLTTEDIATYLEIELPGHELPPSLARLLHDKTEGSPLFVVDLVRYLRERGVIARDGDSWKLTRSVEDIETKLPESIRSMIERKIERLDKDDRRLLQIGSVQGYQFDTATLARVLDAPPEDVDDRLEVLDRDHGLVASGDELELPDGTFTVRYRFVHVLYQNVLYDALTRSRRASTSAKVARALRSYYGDRAPEIAAELALLYEASRDAEGAARCCLTAAENAARVFAAQETVLLARRGLAHVEALPESLERHGLELGLQLVLGPALMVTKGMGSSELEAAFGRARELSHLIGETPKLFPVLRGLFPYYTTKLEFRTSRELADSLLRLANEADDETLVLEAERCMGWHHFFGARHENALDHLSKAIDLYDPARHGTLAPTYGDDPFVMAKALGALSFGFTGRPETAKSWMETSLDHARALAHPYSLAFSNFLYGLLRLMLRDVADLDRSSSEALDVAAEFGFAHWTAEATIIHGWVAVENGDPAAGCEEMERGLALWKATGATVFPYHLTLIGVARGGMNDLEAALATLDESVQMAESTDWRSWLPETWRSRAEVLLRMGRQSESDESYERAIEIAQAQGTKLWELRATASLFRALAERGEAARARPRLEACYSRFDEGFDTVDLTEARSLLDSGA